jgi:hypothetical protein
MNRKDIATIATVALGTATLTVAGFWAGPIDAGAESDPPPAKVNKTSLVTHGIEMTLAPAAGRIFKAGEQPEFELTALNTTAEAASAPVCVSLNASSPRDMMSRVMVLPMVLWQHDQIVKLQPKERKTFTLCANTNLPPNQMFTVSLREPEQKGGPVLRGVMALTFSTVDSKAAPTVALMQ